MEKNLGHATAYGYAKSKGYSGTEEEFAELMADYASVGQSAAQSAEQAAASASSASGSAATATQAAQTATDKASEAVTAADTATTKASEASTSADTASNAATSAITSAQTATTAATTATTKASEASESAATATTAKNDAESARDAAAQSANEAAASAASIDPETLEHKAYGAYVVESTSGAIASFDDGADNIPMKDVLVHIEPVQAGSGDPSPDNVRPITGWTGAKVTRCGKNLLPNNLVSRTVNEVTYVKNSDGSITLNGTATNDFNIPIYGSGSSDLKPFPYSDKPITISGCPVGGGASSYRLGGYLYKNGQYTGSAIIDTGDSKTVSNVDFNQIYFVIFVYSGYTFNNLTFYPMIEYGISPTDYEPYSGQTYDITFPSEAGTVYGGTLDVTSGVLTVDRAMVDLGTLQWNYDTTYKFFITTTQSLTNRKVGVLNVFSDIFKTESGSWSGTPKENVLWGNGSNKNTYVQCPLTTVEDFLTLVTGHQLCYELATPITYQLTPQEITSLLGANNLWADTGDSDVEYRADTKMYITKKITEAVSALS